ncbi:MAG: VWA domain-containing protein [Rikenellaceae bacterium]
MLRFENPELLYLLLLLPLLAVMMVLATIARRRRLKRFGNIDLLLSLMPDRSKGRVNLKMWLYLIPLTLLIFAAARPQVGSKLREQKSQGVEMMLTVDVSNSMLAEDFEPNRLERTKFAINNLFEGLNQERVGVVAFAGDAVVQLPITSDYRMARSLASRLSPSLVGEQGTAIGRALDLTMLSFSEESDRSKVIVLITDGENHEDDAIEAAQRAKAAGVTIFTIGIGTPEGAPISINGEFIKDEDGNMVVSKLGESMLSEIAQITGGGYVRATRRSLGLAEIKSAIEQMEQGELTTMRFEEYFEYFIYLVAIAFALLLLEPLISERRNPMLRRFNIFSTGDSASRKI